MCNTCSIILQPCYIIYKSIVTVGSLTRKWFSISHSDYVCVCVPVRESVRTHLLHNMKISLKNHFYFVFQVSSVTLIFVIHASKCVRQTSANMAPGVFHWFVVVLDASSVQLRAWHPQPSAMIVGISKTGISSVVWGHAASLKDHSWCIHHSNEDTDLPSNCRK